MQYKHSGDVPCCGNEQARHGAASDASERGSFRADLTRVLVGLRSAVVVGRV